MGQRLINACATSRRGDRLEYNTPTGATPEPIEIAVQALRVRNGTLERTRPVGGADAAAPAR